MKRYKKNIGLFILIVIALILICTDIILESNFSAFNEINKILFSMISVIAGFWITGYLLYLQIYKDRYPLKYVENKYLPQMKCHMKYIIYCIVYGCIIIINGKGLLQNVGYLIITLYTTFIVLKHIYDISKTIMLNTYIDDFCEEISKKLENKENCINKDAFTELRFTLDECVVKEEYFIVQNISKKSGEIFIEFLKNAARLQDAGEDKLSIEDSFDRIVDIGIYQLELCKDISSDLIKDEITMQQINNIRFCIDIEHYEWFKKYIEQIKNLTFEAQENGDEAVVEQLFAIYIRTLKKLIKEKKMEWIEFMFNKLFSMTMSLNFLSSNINLKHFASLIVYGLLNCEKGELYDYIYEVFEKFTKMVYRVSRGFSDIKVYYALYFNKLIKDNDGKILRRFLDTIFKYDFEKGNDTGWIEFKFYCIREVLEKNYDIKDLDINEYHIKLLVEVIEMKDNYKGYLLLPGFEDMFQKLQHSKNECKKICDEIEFLINKSIVNDNLNFYFVIVNKINVCLANTKVQNKHLQLILFDIYIWTIIRTRRLNNKQFNEIVFVELEDVLNELDKNKAISNDFGDKIILDLIDLAKQSNSDSFNVVLEIIELFKTFLRENNEFYFVHNSLERKELLYKGIFNIATVCVENDFEEGVRRCSNAIGWFTIYSIKQGNRKLTGYLIKLAKELFDISREMNVSTKTQTFLLTLFTTVGMYCCKESINYNFVEQILDSISNVDKRLVYTAIKIRTYENDMWDALLEKHTQQLANKFIKRYETYKKNRCMAYK